MPPKSDREKELKQRMRVLHIYEKDLEEKFIRSSGPGGQNINKVSTCVCLMHRPSGIQVKAQEERSQAMNRYRARVRLVEKIEKARRQKAQKALQAKAKARRQRRKRSKASKEAVLQKKRKQSEIKQTRRKINVHRIDDY